MITPPEIFGLPRFRAASLSVHPELSCNPMKVSINGCDCIELDAPVLTAEAVGLMPGAESVMAPEI